MKFSRIILPVFLQFLLLIFYLQSPAQTNKDSILIQIKTDSILQNARIKTELKDKKLKPADFQKGIAFLKKVNNEPALAEMYRFRYQYYDNSLDSTLFYAARCIVISNKNNMQWLIDDTYDYVAQLAHRNNEMLASNFHRLAVLTENEAPQPSLRCYERAASAYMYTGNLVAAAECELKLAEIYADYFDEIQRAINHAELAKKNFAQANDTLSLAKAYNKAGFLWTRTGDFPKATNEIRTAIRLCKKIHDKAGEAEAYYNLGRVHEYTTKPDSAIIDYLNAKEILKFNPRPELSFAVNNRLIKVLTETGKGTDATMYHDENILILKKQNVDKRKLLEFYFFSANYAAATNNPEKLQEYFELYEALKEKLTRQGIKVREE